MRTPYNEAVGSKRPTGRPKKAVSHRDICRATASISAHMRCGNIGKARKHALDLVKYLIAMDLIAPRSLDDAE